MPDTQKTSKNELSMTIDTLPSQVVQEILKKKVLSAPDRAKFARACQRLSLFAKAAQQQLPPVYYFSPQPVNGSFDMDKNKYDTSYQAIHMDEKRLIIIYPNGEDSYLYVQNLMNGQSFTQAIKQVSPSYKTLSIMPFHDKLILKSFRGALPLFVLSFAVDDSHVTLEKSNVLMDFLMSGDGELIPLRNGKIVAMSFGCIKVCPGDSSLLNSSGSIEDYREWPHAPIGVMGKDASTRVYYSRNNDFMLLVKPDAARTGVIFLDRNQLYHYDATSTNFSEPKHLYTLPNEMIAKTHVENLGQINQAEYLIRVKNSPENSSVYLLNIKTGSLVKEAGICDFRDAGEGRFVVQSSLKKDHFELWDFNQQQRCISKLDIAIANGRNIRWEVMNNQLGVINLDNKVLRSAVHPIKTAFGPQLQAQAKGTPTSETEEKSKISYVS